MTSAISLHHVEKFRSLIAERLGLQFDDSKLSVLADTLRWRLAAHGGISETYLQNLAMPCVTTEEVRCLAEALTVTETYFFRNADQIRAFIERVIPQHLASCSGARKLRVLSAGCASGEEPYSLAIAIRERLPDAADRVAITAVDVNPAMLAKAQCACYSNWSLRELPAQSRDQWFKAEARGFVLDRSIRNMVTFEEHNLACQDVALWQPRAWNVVFCRNVLMYFAPALMQSVIARIAEALIPGGYLFMGHAETLRGLSSDFHLCHTHETFYYERKQVLCESTPAAAAAPAIDWATQPRVDDLCWVDTVRRASERIHELAQDSQELASERIRGPTSVAEPRASEVSRAIELLRHERFSEAIDHLRTLPAEQTRDPAVLLLRATSLLHAGALEQAERVCRELLSQDEMNAGAYYILALCREACGDLPGAVEQNRLATYLDPRFSMARLHLGRLARRRGEREAARRELAQAIVSLQQEDGLRLLLFGGGFSREALVALCQSELIACGEAT